MSPAPSCQPGDAFRLFRIRTLNTHLAVAVALDAPPVEWQACAGGIRRHQLVANLHGGAMGGHTFNSSSQHTQTQTPLAVIHNTTQPCDTRHLTSVNCK
jgi:hypothetical protein